MSRRASGALALPALTSPGLRAVLGFCVAAPWVVVAVAWVTAPATRPFAVVAPAFSLFVLVLVWRVRELEGAVLRERRMGVLTRALDLSTARRVEVRGNRAGAAVLQVHPAGSRRGLTLVLQAKTAYVDAARPFDQLEALAAAVASAPATGAGRAARLLRAQAAHLRAGGDYRTAPLAALTGDLTGMVGGAGVAGGATGVFD
jgi:hypothetical protein